MTPAQAMARAIALSLAERPHPNPRVGAILLGPNGEELSVGAHRGPGHPHAERIALDGLNDSVPTGSTLVVTLEPCNHHGRTPPCTEAILDAGIGQVVVGTLDPDHRVAGTGVARLRAGGITVEVGEGAGDVEAADPAYFHHRRTGRSHVTVKYAATLDGQTAAADGTSQWITSVEARLDAQLLRAEMDAVVVGANTLRTDNPRLTVRTPDFVGSQPRPVVVAGQEDLPLESQLWDRPDALVVAARPIPSPVEVIVVEAGSDGYPDPESVTKALGDRGLLGLLVEGGAKLLGSFWNRGIVDAGVTYFGAKIAGGTGRAVFDGRWSNIGEATDIEIRSVTMVGPDVRVVWRLPGGAVPR